MVSGYRATQRLTPVPAVLVLTAKAASGRSLTTAVSHVSITGTVRPSDVTQLHPSVFFGRYAEQLRKANSEVYRVAGHEGPEEE